MAPPLDLEDVDFGDDVDVATFEQILDMDDEDDDSRDFSSSIVFGFLEQAEQTFATMEKALENKDLPELSNLGHFLKGSSATLGFSTVRDECEKIQNYGHQKDGSGQFDEPDAQKCLAFIADSISAAKKAYERVKVLMHKIYN